MTDANPTPRRAPDADAVCGTCGHRYGEHAMQEPHLCWHKYPEMNGTQFWLCACPKFTPQPDAGQAESEYTMNKYYHPNTNWKVEVNHPCDELVKMLRQEIDLSIVAEGELILRNKELEAENASLSAQLAAAHGMVDGYAVLVAERERLKILLNEYQWLNKRETLDEIDLWNRSRKAIASP